MNNKLKQKKMKTLVHTESEFKSACLFDDITYGLFEVGKQYKYQTSDEFFSPGNEPSGMNYYELLIADIDSDWMNFAEYHFASQQDLEADLKLLNEYAEVNLIKINK